MLNEVVRVNVLLLDNNERELEDIEDLLEGFDVQVFLAYSIIELKNKIQSHSISLVILNTQLLDLNDRDCLKHFTNDSDKRLIPAIFVFKYYPQRLDLFSELNGDYIDFLVLPIIPEFFKHKIQQFFNLFIKARSIEKLKLELNKKTDELDRLKSAFLSNVSHEIRTPMNAIIGFSDMLSNDDFNESEKSSFVEIIQENCNKLMNFIDDIIDISRLEASEIRENKSVFRLNDLMEGLYKRYLSKDSDNVELKMYLETLNRDLIILADSFRLNQILVILLDNAYKFIGTGKVSFGYKFIDNEKLEFFVSDNGPGIPEEFHISIFERFNFYSPNKERLYSGAGLGLSICKHLIKLLNGEIWLESVINKGSTFYFSIPVVRRFTGSNTHLDLSTMNNGSHDKSILVLEDDIDRFNAIKSQLNILQVNLLNVKSGKEVILEYLKDLKPEMVLMDIRKIIDNSLEAVKIYRKNTFPLPVSVSGFDVSMTKFRDGSKMVSEELATESVIKDLVIRKVSRFFKS